MVLIRRPFGIFIESLVLVTLALVAGTVSNALLPDGIPLMAAEVELDAGMPMSDALRLHQDGAVFVDARDQGPYQIAHVPGAINIPPGMYMDEMENKLQDVSKDETIVVYCSSETCPLAEQVAQALQLMGYGDVRVFEQGFIEWRLEGGPVEEG